MMERWETELMLKFRYAPWKLRIRFCFEWKAWLIAYEITGLGPEQFNKLPTDRQVDAIAFGAAQWARVKEGKKPFFTADQMKEALMRASRAENLKLTEALAYAQFPDWLKQGMSSDEKKNSES